MILSPRKEERIKFLFENIWGTSKSSTIHHWKSFGSRISQDQSINSHISTDEWTLQRNNSRKPSMISLKPLMHQFESSLMSPWQGNLQQNHKGLLRETMVERWSTIQWPLLLSPKDAPYLQDLQFFLLEPPSQLAGDLLQVVDSWHTWWLCTVAICSF